MEKVTAIFKVHTSLEAIAQECLQLFGKGARNENCGELYWFAYNNTPVQHGHVRIPLLVDIAQQLETATDQGYVSPNAELIRVEWYGQDRVVTGTDSETDEPIIEEQLYQVATEDITDESGDVIGQRPVYLGRISV